MTNELEKNFFDTFGIEPILDCKRCGAMNFALGQCAEVDCKKTYPQITDTHYLKLICLLNITLIKIVKLRGNNLEQLKSFILQGCITDYDFYSNSSLPEHREQAKDLKHQVRTLFEEG